MALEFDSSDDEKAFLLIQADATPSAAKTLEDECVLIVRHALLGSEGEPWHRLDGTLKELNGLFKGLILSKAMEDVHAIVALLDRSGSLHVSHAGRGEAYLLRNGLAAQITEFSRGKPLTAFVHISSGQLEPGDSVILATQRLLRTFTPAQLAAIPVSEAVPTIISTLESEREAAAIASVRIPAPEGEPAARADRTQERETAPSRASSRIAARRPAARRGRGGMFAMPDMQDVMDGLKTGGSWLAGAVVAVGRQTLALGKKGASRAAKMDRSKLPSLTSVSGGVQSISKRVESFVADLRHPQRKRRAHLLLLAGGVATFLVIFMLVSLSTSSRRNKSRTELADLVTQINSEIRTADTRKIAGDNDAANTILQRAEERAKQVMDNESGLFRVEALDLLDRIRQKREELNNIVRVSPRVVVNLSSQNADVDAQGMIGLGDGEFVVYDQRSSYRVLLSRLDEAKRVVEDELILQGARFDRFDTQVFMTTGNSVVELTGNQLTTMKTDDPNGWIVGKDIETYLRYLYVLAPEKKQIYKYERLSNRYGSPVPYNVNGDLMGALDMSIDGSVYVLKEGGTVVKLLRGEAQPFAIRRAPEDALKAATRMFKVADGKFYFLDPERNRVSVVTDGGTAGEATYVKQYILEGDQLGTLQDLYVDPDQSHIYVIDEKRLYVVDMAS